MSSSMSKKIALSVMESNVKSNDRSLKKWESSGLAEDALKIANAIHNNGNSFSQQTKDEVLITACIKGRKFLVQVLLTAGAYVNAKDKNGNTPLSLCAERGHVDIAKVLGSNGADMNSKNVCGETPLSLSICAARSREVISYLISDANTDIDLRTQAGELAMRRAIEIIDVNTMMSILNKNFDGRRCASEVKLSKSLKATVKRLGLEKLLEVLIPHNYNEPPPLVKAAQLGSYEVVSLLCASGHEANVQKEQVTPLLASSRLGRLDLVDLLISYNAEVNMMRRSNEFKYPGSPLHAAISGGHIKCIKLLLQHGAHLDLHSAIIDTIKCQELRSLEFLMDHFPEEATTLVCTTGLGLQHYAAMKNDEEIVIFLLDHGSSDVNLVYKKMTLLHALSERVINALLERGADINFRNDYGGKALNHLGSSGNTPNFY